MTTTMDVRQLLEEARDVLTVRRVFGEPIERDGVTVLPVARVRGGGGGGSGDGPEGKGVGGGAGFSATPAGVYVIAEGRVRWQPAVDVDRVVLGGQVVAVVGLLTVRSLSRARRRRRRGRG
jgi:uncharacterized spore protein YtfJ